MGMSIDEAIRYYEDKNVVLTEEEALANTIALNTMRKYQKICKIVKFGNVNELGFEYVGEKITEVVELW